MTTSRTPCAFTGTSATIAPLANITITSVYGHAPSLEVFLKNISPMLRTVGFISASRAIAKSLAENITARAATKSGVPVFDAHVRQSFLDNTLRGGLPIDLGTTADGKPATYHVYSRIHGDIERDYNNFQLDPSFFSQGPGNFRDVSQNRRLDVLFDPTVGDFNVKVFFSFLQADGYNPLTVASALFKVRFVSQRLGYHSLSHSLPLLLFSLLVTTWNSSYLISWMLGSQPSLPLVILSKTKSKCYAHCWRSPSDQDNSFQISRKRVWSCLSARASPYSHPSSQSTSAIHSLF